MRFEAVSPLPTTSTFTIMRWGGGWGGTNRVAQFDNSDGTRKLLLPVDLSQATCNGDRCLRGKFLVTAVTAHPWHADSAYPTEVQEGYPENGYPEAGPGTRVAPALVGFTFMGEAGLGGGVASNGLACTARWQQTGRLRPQTSQSLQPQPSQPANQPCLLCLCPIAALVCRRPGPAAGCGGHQQHRAWRHNAVHLLCSPRKRHSKGGLKRLLPCWCM